MLSAAFLAVILSFAQAQPPPTPPAESNEEENTVEGVVVEGRRPLSEKEQRKAESDFVRRHSVPTLRNRLARWDDEVCPGVFGWPEREAVYVAERIAEEARAVGLEVGGAGCRPDIVILVTDNGDRAAQQANAHNRKFFAHIDKRGARFHGGAGQTLETFLTRSRPVRWWHVAEFKSSDGRPIQFGSVVANAPVVPILETVGSSRLASQTKEDLARALIIVDTSLLQGVSYEALASYLAMVSLAQLDPDAEAGEALPTILSLFEDRDRGAPLPETLTAWDRAYLRGLYDSPDNAKGLNTQRGAIRRSFRKARGGG